MASTAAVLNILVAAQTGPAQAKLLALETQLRKTGTTADTTSDKVGPLMSKRAKLGAAAVGGVTVAAYALGKGLVASVKAASSFESSFAEVRKTVDTNERGFKRIERGLRSLAKEIPTPVEELNNLAGEAGALGIKAKDIVAFTRVAAQLGTTTNLSSSEAANALARLSNIMGTSSSQFENMASALVGLGNAGASTEAEIAAMALRIAATGKQVGLSEADVLGFASALSSVGIEAEAGGSAISRAFALIATSVATGNKELSGFAEVAQMSVPQFTKLFNKDAAQGMLAFIKGLGEIKENGGNALVELEKLGINEIRLRNALLSAAGAGDLFNKQLNLAGKEFRDNNALTEEAEKRYKTFDSQVQILKQSFNDLAITVGQQMLPALTGITKAVNGIVSNLDFDNLTNKIQVLPGVVFQVKDALGFMNTKFLESIPVVGQFVLVGKALGKTFEGLNSIFGKDTQTSFQERLKRTSELIRNVSQRGLGAVNALAKQTNKEEGLRKRSQAATRRAKRAEEEFIAARKKFGPASQQAITAEARYHLALQKSERLKERVAKAERLSGVVRRATKRITESSITTLKAEIFQNERLINKKGKQVEIEQRKETPSKKRIARLSREIIDLSKQNGSAQDRVNRIIQRAAGEIGPRFARSLERMSGKTAAFKKSIGTLPGPITKVGNTTDREFGKARKSTERFADTSEKTRRRVNQANRAMPPVVESSTGQIMNTFKNRIEGLNNLGKPRVSRRKGGKIPGVFAHFERGGMVPAAVSPGEMISYGNQQMIVPGRPEPRDSVMMGLPAGAKVFTWDGQMRLAGGASESEALKKQAPHFAGGGIVKPKILGGSTKANQYANKAVDGVHSVAKDWLDKIAKSVRSSFGGASGQYPGVSGDTDFTPALGRALSKMARSSGQSIFVQSGWRSYAEQAALYQAYLNGTGNLAAPPGSSNHESGLAADITPGSEVFGGMAGRFGLGFTVPGESWHIELLRRGGIAGRALQKLRKGGWVKMGATIDPTAGQPEYGNFGGMSFAELLVSGTNAGLASQSLASIFGLNSPNWVGMPMRTPLKIRMPGKGSGKTIYKLDNGSGQAGNPWYKIDLHQGIANALGWSPNQDVEVARTDGKAGQDLTLKEKRENKIQKLWGAVRSSGKPKEKDQALWKLLSYYAKVSNLGKDEKSDIVNLVRNGKLMGAARYFKKNGKVSGEKGENENFLERIQDAKKWAGVKEKREREIAKLWRQYDPGMSPLARYGALWPLLEAYAQYSDIGWKGRDFITNLVSQGAGKESASQAVPFLEKAAHWFTKNGKISGGPAGDNFLKRLRKAKGKGQSSAMQQIKDRASIYPQSKMLDLLDYLINYAGEEIDIASAFHTSRESASPTMPEGVAPDGTLYTEGEVAKERGLNLELLGFMQDKLGTIGSARTYLKDLITNYGGRVAMLSTQRDDLLEKAKKAPPPKRKKLLAQAKLLAGEIKAVKGGIKTAMTERDVELPQEMLTLQGYTGQGGQILDVQNRLKELGFIISDQNQNLFPPSDGGDTPTTDPTDGADDGRLAEIAEILRAQLFESQRALAISQAQMPIFQQYLPRFHSGGIVGGYQAGGEVPIMAQAGEGVFTRDQMRAMSPNPNVTVVIEDGAIDKSKIRVEVDGVLADKISSARRQIPGRSYASR